MSREHSQDPTRAYKRENAKVETDQKLPEQREPLDENELEMLLHKYMPQFRAWGYPHVESKKQHIKDYQGRIYGLQLSLYNEKLDSYEDAWIVIDHSLDSGREYAYRFSLNNEILDTYQIPDEFELEWIRDVSSSTKIVKSRPSYLYPELFGLPADEVWSKNAKSMVIGDPYQLCDREGVTIIEYEYAEEIVPPIIDTFYGSRRDFTHNECVGWYENLHHEDLRSLGGMYGMYTPDNGNPYRHFAEECFHRVVDVLSAMEQDVQGNGAKQAEMLWSSQQEINELRTLLQKILDGIWEVDDFRDAFEGTSAWDDFMKFFQYKQYAMEQLGDPSAWKDYIGEWETYLEQLPYDYLRARITDFDTRVSRVKKILADLPTTKSARLANDRVEAVQNFYEENLQYYDRNDPALENLSVSALSDTYSRGLMSDGALGFFRPGFVLNARSKRFLEECVRHVERMHIYRQGILPKLDSMHQQTQQVGFGEETMTHLLASFERPLLREYLFKKRTERAIPLHGFFPHDMPKVDQQDRIIALTSVTMHGWNYLDEAGFYHDIESSLPFLKIGGKYILGPVNQSVYFRGHNDMDFDAQALTRALKKMEQEGHITYEFVKQDPDDRNPDFGYSEKSEENDPDVHVLHNDEAARSLVITRIA